MAFSGAQLFLLYSGLFFAALVFSLLINSLFMRFARTLGMREKDLGLERWSASHKPAFGGIGFYIIFLVSFTLHGVLFPGDGAVLRPELLGLLAATGLGFLMGLADDAYNTQPLLKFLVQIACGAILIASGTEIELFESRWANIAITVFWVVGMMNSINMLDNMDGVATAVTMAILAAATVLMIGTGAMDPVYMVLFVGTMASLGGFLFYNWNPSRMFMGDTGSQFLGVLIAFIGVRFFWNAVSPAGAHEPARQILAPIIVFLLPICDTTTVSINRIMRGRSPFVGGRDHTTHHLSYLGLSDAQVAFTFIGLSLLNVFLAYVMLRYIEVWENLHTAIFVSYALLVLASLFTITHRSKPPASSE
jgi:UDP-GlcNAc:undecaprenyl-phosphate GlcNAc-1-phosphate transferase